MEVGKLKEQEERFLRAYPGGFSHPEMLAIAKKHHIDKLVKQAAEELGPEAFEDFEGAVKAVERLLSRASLVSVFEKTAFRNYVAALPAAEKAGLAAAVRELLHGDQQSGFEALVDLLTPYKLAKWPLITALLYYRDPANEVVIKPTTVKGVISTFGLEGVVYPTRPDYGFYRAYREQLKVMRQQLGPELQVENGAFCGFLMYAMGQFE